VAVSTRESAGRTVEAAIIRTIPLTQLSLGRIAASKDFLARRTFFSTQVAAWWVDGWIGGGAAAETGLGKAGSWPGRGASGRVLLSKGI
jgi:hypothetical protein